MQAAGVESGVGFALPELLVAATLVLLLMAGLAAVVGNSHDSARTQAAADDIRLRLRGAYEALSSDLHAAGSGPVNGLFGRALGMVTPVVLPFGLGSRGDPAGTVRSDALSVVFSAGVGAAAELAGSFVPGGMAAEIRPVPGCPEADASCGIEAGMSVLLTDGSGQSDYFNVSAASGQWLTLTPRGLASGRTFPAGSKVIPVTVVCYRLLQGTPADGLQLMAGDGDTWELPLVDHLTGMTVELMGEPRPPQIEPPGAPPLAATYGPAPPPAGIDDPRDDWPAGENCTFTATASGVHYSRLPWLPTSGTALATLAPSVLTDGPWCPDASAPNRFDADLLRVRAVRVTIRAEAGSATARGRDPRLFVHPGLSRDRSGVAADQVVVLDVVPRALQAGR